MRSSTLEQWQGSRNNYLSIFSYVAINFNHSSAYHSLLPDFSQSKTELSQTDRRLIRCMDRGVRVGMVIKRLQLLRAKCFQVNVTRGLVCCHSHDETCVVADGTSGARWTVGRCPEEQKDWWTINCSKQLFLCGLYITENKHVVWCNCTVDSL